MKTCRICQKELEETNFYKKKDSKDGLRTDCKECADVISKQYAHRYKERDNLRSRTWNKINKERKLNNDIAWIKNNPEKVKQYKKTSNKRYHEKNPNYTKDHYIKNKQYFKKYNKTWEQNNRERRREYKNNKRKIDINYRIRSNLRCRIFQALKGKSKSAHTIELIGCSIQFLKQHLQESAIKNGFIDFDIETYDTKQYHIDHIIPCHAFNMKCSYHQRICFHWSNMQILESSKNISKYNKIDFSLVEEFKSK